MTFLDLIENRYSVRAYKPDPVEKEKLEYVLEAARLAPTAANRQPFQLLIIETAGRKQELVRIYGRPFFTQAPLVICSCAIRSQAWTRKQDNANFGHVDATIAMDHLILAAAEQGLGTCWIAAFDPVATKEVLGLPGVEPVVLTTLGYPADARGTKNRKPLSELVRYGHW
ncbi:MAG: nitroreductase family protein [Desulfotomaculaceae bacterium]|nr:nitroreductase family protein [Desulfotomaculaceae bacterium]